MIICLRLHIVFSGGFRGGPSLLRPSPPPLGDGLTQSLTAMLGNAKFWSFYCKRGTQNIQNDFHQWLSDRFKSAPNSFGELTALPQTL